MMSGEAIFYFDEHVSEERASDLLPYGWRVTCYSVRTEQVEVPDVGDSPPYRTMPGGTTTTVNAIWAGIS